MLRQNDLCDSERRQADMRHEMDHRIEIGSVIVGADENQILSLAECRNSSFDLYDPWKKLNVRVRNDRAQQFKLIFAMRDDQIDALANGSRAHIHPGSLHRLFASMVQRGGNCGWAQSSANRLPPQFAGTAATELQPHLR